MAPLARKPSISVALNPSCRRTSSLCSPIFVNLWGALRGHFGDAMHLKRAADRGRQLAAGTIERNDDVVRLELGIFDHLLRPTHRSERHVNAIEHLVPRRHRLRTEDFLEDPRELRPIRLLLRWPGKTPAH